MDLSCILLCTEATSFYNTAGALLGTCWKTSSHHLWLPGEKHVHLCHLIYDILRGSPLSGNDYSMSNFIQRHCCTATHLQTRIPHEEEICFQLQKNKTSLDAEMTPCKDCDCIFTKEPKAAIVRHRGGPSQLKEWADWRVNLSPMLMHTREHSRGQNTNSKDEKKVHLGRKGMALSSSLEALNRSSQTPGMLVWEKVANNC